MSKKNLIATAVGTAFVAGMTAAPIASAADNPFALSGLSSGYQVAAAHGAKPVESTGDATKAEAGKTTTEKAKEGKCGGKTEADMKAKEGKCGNAEKMKDGKCGEGKCGGAKKPADAKPVAK